MQNSCKTNFRARQYRGIVPVMCRPVAAGIWSRGDVVQPPVGIIPATSGIGSVAEALKQNIDAGSCNLVVR